MMILMTDCVEKTKAAHPLRPDFWQLPLDSLNRHEWEALCDGCGVCCLIKYLDDEHPKFTEYTDVACQLLDCSTGHCKDYAARQAHVPDCISLGYEMLPAMMWLPRHCAYKRLYLGQGLPAWHYLLAGRQAHDKAMDKVGVRGRCYSEKEFDEEEIETRIIRWVKV